MKLPGLWLLLSALIALLTIINPNRFLSIDSQYYLSTAGWLVGLDGHAYGHRSTGWDSTFPVGYPLLIGCLARLTGTSLLVASKGLNGLLIGLFLGLWRRRLGATTARWMGSVLLLGGFLRILAYTWSEWAFLVLLLEWYWLDSHRPARPTAGYVSRLLVVATGLFLLRYVGSVVVVAYGLRALFRYRRGSGAGRVGTDLGYVLAMVALMGSYAGLNHWLTGSPYGGVRFVETGETTGHKIAVVGLALLNEVLLLRDYVPGEPTALVWLGVLGQIGLAGWLWHLVRDRLRTRLPPSETLRQLYRSWAWTSATYLVVLGALRFVSPFSGPNARLMSVVTLPLLLGLAAWVSRWPDLALRRRVARWWVIGLLASGLQLLPQADLVGKLNRLGVRWPDRSADAPSGKQASAD